MSNSYVVSYATSCDLVCSVGGPRYPCVVRRSTGRYAKQAAMQNSLAGYYHIRHTSTSRDHEEEWAHSPRVDQADEPECSTMSRVGRYERGACVLCVGSGPAQRMGCATGAARRGWVPSTHVRMHARNVFEIGELNRHTRYRPATTMVPREAHTGAAARRSVD